MLIVTSGLAQCTGVIQWCRRRVSTSAEGHAVFYHWLMPEVAISMRVHYLDMGAINTCLPWVRVQLIFYTPPLTGSIRIIRSIRRLGLATFCFWGTLGVRTFSRILGYIYLARVRLIVCFFVLPCT